MSALKLPNGPQTHPWVQTYQWLTNPLEYMEACAKRYGDIFTLRIGPVFTPQVFVSNPQAIQQIFSTDPKHLDSGVAAGSGAPLLGQNSLLSLEGKPHQRQRKLLTPPLHGERMQAYGDLICQITKQVTSQWAVGETFTVLSSMQEISFQVILKAVFGLKDGLRYEKLKEILIAILNPKRPILRAILLLFPLLRQDLGPRSPWGSYLCLRQKMDDLIYAEIQERRSLGDQSRSDILSLMMAARDEAGEPMTDLELRDELITLLVAGHETTASSLAWALYWIHHQPEVREKLVQELDNLGDNKDPNAIFRLPYLNAVCSETMRLYPLAMLGLNRLVKSPLEIAGYKFDPGTILVPCIYLSHHREDLYPNSKQFKPDRFLERQFTSAEYLPFGGGNRRCIGMAFALFEMKLVLATVLSTWQMKLADTNPVLPVRKSVLLAPGGGVSMVVTGRREQNQAVRETSLVYCEKFLNAIAREAFTMKDVANLVDEIIAEKGYVLIPEVLNPTQAQEARSLVLQLAEKEKLQGKLLPDQQAERLYGLVYKGEIFELMVQHPTVIAVVEAILGEDVTLGGFSAHILNPGAKNMGVHVDYPYWTMKPPFPAYPVMEIQVIWMVEDFTQQNGAPVFAPGSQKLCSPPDLVQFSKTGQKVTGKAGSMVISHGLCWHDTSINSSVQPRVSILGNYAPKYVRPLENPLDDMQQEVLDRASPKLKQLLGYEFKSALYKDAKKIRAGNWYD